MTTFQPEMSERFATLLDSREAQLRALLAEEASQAQALAEQADAGREVTDSKDLAEVETFTTVHDLQHAHAVQELEAVQAARHRLATGRYGECVTCGEPIELRRLEALPIAMRCMRCQSLAERAQ